MPSPWKYLIRLSVFFLGTYLLLYVATCRLRQPLPSFQDKSLQTKGKSLEARINKNFQELPPAMIKGLLQELATAMQLYYFSNEEFPPKLTLTTLKELKDYTDVDKILKFLEGHKIDSYRRGEQNFEILVTVKSKDKTRYRITATGVALIR